MKQNLVTLFLVFSLCFLGNLICIQMSFADEVFDPDQVDYGSTPTLPPLNPEGELKPVVVTENILNDTEDSGNNVVIEHFVYATPVKPEIKEVEVYKFPEEPQITATYVQSVIDDLKDEYYGEIKARLGEVKSIDEVGTLDGPGPKTYVIFTNTEDNQFYMSLWGARAYDIGDITNKKMLKIGGGSAIMLTTEEINKSLK